jgi:hypothetical protein
VETVVALDKLASKGQSGIANLPPFKPRIPALAVQSEYGFNVQPYWTSYGSSFTPEPGDPTKRPPPRRELETGFDGWRKAHRDVMTIVPRASTHLEYTDIAFALPASRYGQDLTSVYVQRWLDRYLKHRRVNVRATSFKYLEPAAVRKWEPRKLDRASLLSFYFCSGYAFGRWVSTDIAAVGGCPR